MQSLLHAGPLAAGFEVEGCVGAVEDLQPSTRTMASSAGRRVTRGACHKSRSRSLTAARCGILQRSAQSPDS